MDIIVRKQAIYISAAHVLSVQVIHGDIRVILENHTGYDLVAYLKVFSCAVFFNVLSHFDNFAGSFMAQSHGNQSERILLEFVCVGSADTAAFHFYKNIIVSHFGDGEFLHIVMLQACQHGHMRRLRDCSRRSASCAAVCRRLSAFHAVEDLSYDFFYIRCINVHFSFPFCPVVYDFQSYGFYRTIPIVCTGCLTLHIFFSW